MRDIKRIDDFCERLAKAWKKCPDMRFMQLMSNYAGEEGRDTWHDEEDYTIEHIEKWVDSHYPNAKVEATEEDIVTLSDMWKQITELRLDVDKLIENDK